MRRCNDKCYAVLRRCALKVGVLTLVFVGAIWSLALTVLLATETLTPEQAKQIFDLTERAVVQLQVEGRLDGNEKNTAYGTGFAVQTSSGWRIITARHVVGQEKEWDVVDGRPDRDIYIRFLTDFGPMKLEPLYLAASNPTYDVAQIFVRPGTRSIPLSDTPVRSGERVVVVSWKYDRNARRQTPAIWRTAKVLDSERVLMRLEGDFRQSESGSPVLNGKGEVVGVLVERGDDNTASAVETAAYVSWVRDYQPDILNYSKPEQIENLAKLARRCIFLGKRSALATGKSKGMPFGQDLLRRISSKGGPADLAGTTLTAPSAVEIRSRCPRVKPDGAAFYGSVVGTLRAGERALVRSVHSFEYFNDTFYWAIVDKLDAS